MKDVEIKFIKELQEDSVIITCRFPLPTISEIKTIGEGVDMVWIYKISKSLK